jgi:hypothetical protein
MRGTLVKHFIPFRCHPQAFIDAEDAVPVEFCMGLIAAQFKQLCFMGGLGIGKVMPGANAPVLDQSIDYL